MIKLTIDVTQEDLSQSIRCPIEKAIREQTVFTQTWLDKKYVCLMLPVYKYVAASGEIVQMRTKQYMITHKETIPVIRQFLFDRAMGIECQPFSFELNLPENVAERLFRA